MEHNLVADIAICVIAAWLVAVIGQVARQPVLLAYLLAGYAIGPQGLALVTDAETIQVISHIGLSLLLFMIGLEIDLKLMINAGKAITLTACAQILGCLALGWLVFGLAGLGGGWLEALYFGVAIALSSTVIIVKILYDKRELDTLAGRITLGILVLQDLFVIVFLAVQPDLKDPELALFAIAVAKVVLLVGVGYVASRFLLPPIFHFIARQPELVLVGALAWCFALAGFARYLDLSPEMGALVAGVMVSTFPYTLDVIAKVTSLRDFFVTLFFVGLGMSIPAPTWDIALWTLGVSAFVIATRLITVFPVLYRLRLGHRGSLLPAINLCQISELSLVLFALGKSSGDVSDQAIGIIAFAFAFLAVTSTYAINRSDQLLRVVSPWLTRLGLGDLPAGAMGNENSKRRARVVLLGFSWTASSLLEEIKQQASHLLDDLCIVDFNPVVIERLRARGVRVIYGDISQRDTLLHAGIIHAEIIICSLPDMLFKGASNRRLLKQLQELNPGAKIIIHSDNVAELPSLYAEGASYISVPRLLEANDLLRAIEAADQSLLAEKRERQLAQIAGRDEIIP